MTWNHRYQVKSYLRSAIWVVPLIALPLEQVVWALVYKLDHWLAWKGLALGVTGAREMFNAVTTLTLSCIVFTFGSLLVAIQVAGGQYTPRIIATTLLRDNVIRYTVGLFVFTFLFAVQAADRMETTVNQLAAFVVGLLGLICVVAFLFLIDYAARMLRPVSLVRRVGEYRLKVIKSVYPEQSKEAQSIAESQRGPGPVERIILHHGKSAIVIAVNVEMLVAEAEKANCVIEFAPQVGAFVESGEPLFLLHGVADAIDEQKLWASVVLGSERTMEQDPLFGFRILADIAIKACRCLIRAWCNPGNLRSLKAESGRQAFLVEEKLVYDFLKCCCRERLSRCAHAFRRRRRVSSRIFSETCSSSSWLSSFFRNPASTQWSICSFRRPILLSCSTSSGT